MAKMRVHELAKELDIKSADIVKALGEKGIDIKAMSSVDDSEVKYIKDKFSKSKTSEDKTAEKVTPTEKTEVKEEKKHKRIITSRGMVRLKGDGEERPRRPRPDGEKKRRPRPEGENQNAATQKTEKTETVKKENEQIAKPVEQEKNESANKPVENNVQPKEEKVESVVTPVAKNEPKRPAPTAESAARKAAEIAAKAAAIAESRGQSRNNDRRNNRNGQNRNNRDGQNRNGNGNGQNRNNRDGQNRNNRDGQNRNFGNRDGQNRNNDGKSFNRDNRNGNNRNFNNRNNDGYNKDKDFDRNDNNRRNDRRRDDQKQSAPADIIQSKDRNKRENKLRQDKQERGRKNYEDGNGGRKGKNGRRVDLSKPVLQKPQKKEEKKEEIKVISIPEALTIGELAEKMKMQPSTIIKKLFLEGKMVTVNTEIDFAGAEEIALEYEIMCEKEVKVDMIEELLKEEEENEADMTSRPPVVCVMGHVDHGKTSLLDAIRETNVISGEAGGITQHIGASVVKINDRKITFLDTPGHEAFTAMRMRGAQSTDIAILVVAADDGVMPQTVEAINHAKAAGIEIIVAINKIDKPGANIERVKQELAEYELLAADWGGNTEMVPVSAHTREGIEELLEMVLLQADVLELKANPDRMARGIVIEAKLDKGKGPVSTVLVQKGTLHIGDHIAAGANYGKVRAMTDDRGNRITEAGPSTPVEILGLSGVPNAGEVFVAKETANEAKAFAETFIADSKEKLLEGTKYRISLDDINSQIKAGNLKELNIIIKADVQGSVEAVKQSMLKLSNEEVEVKVIHGGVGAINESDVILASASNAIIIGFNVKPDAQAEEIATREKVDLRLYSVIYNAIEDIERAMKGMLEPIYEEKVIGHAEIRQIFKASGVGNIAGSYVLDGSFKRGCSARITRDGEQIFDGPLASLKRFKDDVKEVKAGYECGLVFEKFNDIAEGDAVEAYMMVEVPR
ncbi:translation initiation factor IF-2 [uncultured Eubacterium sp.]|uniref:translation initiation factor IF-2 n=1 Tax=uncultured Eubacterium sp. TaxID=165185 RepID=UPI003264A6ED